MSLEKKRRSSKKMSHRTSVVDTDGTARETTGTKYGSTIFLKKRHSHDIYSNSERGIASKRPSRSKYYRRMSDGGALAKSNSVGTFTPRDKKRNSVKNKKRDSVKTPPSAKYHARRHHRRSLEEGSSFNIVSPKKSWHLHRRSVDLGSKVHSKRPEQRPRPQVHSSLHS